MTYKAEDFGSGASLWESEFDTPLPGNQAGSWIPTPPPWVFPNAPAKTPFDTPAGDGGPVAPGFGEGYGAEAVFGAASVAEAAMDFQTHPMGLSGMDENGQEKDPMENCYGSLGAEAWYTQIAKAAASIGAAYADKQGLIPESARAAITEAGFLPAAVVETVETEAVAPEKPARPAWVMPAAVGGGLLLLFLVMRNR